MHITHIHVHARAHVRVRTRGDSTVTCTQIYWVVERAEETRMYVCFLARKHGSTSEYSHGTLACTRPRLSTRRHRNTSRVR